MPRYEVRRKDIIREEEVQDLIDHMSSEKDRAMIAVLYLYGCRPHEMCQLKGSDFTITGDKLWVLMPTAKKRTAGRSTFMLPVRKIWCFLDDRFTKFITDYINLMDLDEVLWNYGCSAKVRNTTINRKIKAHNPNVFPYLFRHTRNTIIAENGGTEQQLVNWNGWEDSRPSKNYVQRTQRLIDSVPRGKSEENHL